MSTPRIHLSIVQPQGYVHSLGFLDQARYFRWQFRRLGAEVSIAKNRLRHDAINFVFGAHLGFDTTQCDRHACVFVNLEQMGHGGANVSNDYRQLLAAAPVVDYDADNVATYANDRVVPIVPFLHAPYLKTADALPLESRPIDLLFIGSMNERRQQWLARIEALGLTVSVFDSALYGEERDHFIRQAKAVVNCHFYESSRFEQVRVAHCLSLGTPVISERTSQTRPHEAFEDAVLWLQGDELEQFFGQDWGSAACFDALREAVDRFAAHDPIEAYADLLTYAEAFRSEHHDLRPAAPWQPQAINLGSGKDYQPGWLNLDVIARAEPDLLLDLSKPLALPAVMASPSAGPVMLDKGSVLLINANNVLEHVPDLPALMTNCLRLLADGGELHVEVPYEQAPQAWQDPTHVRAFNENSWLYYTDWFWYLGWFEHRFEVDGARYLNDKLQDCAREQAAFMRLVLRKRETTATERTTARTLQADLRLPDDAPGAVQMWHPAPAVPSNVTALRSAA